MNEADSAWFANEAFWQATFPVMFAETSFAAAAANVPKITTLAGITAGSVLDLACGPGRYAIPFAQAGFRVTGVDRSRFLLDKARDRATREGASVEWIEEDMREFVRPAEFDLAINVFSSFGYFDDATENRRVLENVYSSLNPGGALVFDHVGKEIVAAKYQPTRSEAMPDGAELIERIKVIDDWSRLEREWILLEGVHATRFRFRHWIYSGREIRELFARVGFSPVSLYGSFDGAPYGPSAQRLVVVGKKP